MRDYSKASSRFWTGDTGKMLRTMGRDYQVVGFYLFTCPSANMIGLYYLPLPTLCHEVGSLTREVALEVLRRLSEGGYASYDERAEQVWVCEMAAHQLGETMLPKDNRHKAVVKLLDMYRKSPFFSAFVERYGDAFNLHSALNGPKNGSPSKGSTKALRSKEKEKEKVRGLPRRELATGSTTEALAS